VVLLFLHRRWIDDLVVLLFQIIQYFLDFPRRAFDFLVKLTPLLDRCNSSIRRSKKG
jgi:hypothetical protein